MRTLALALPVLLMACGPSYPQYKSYGKVDHDAHGADHGGDHATGGDHAEGGDHAKADGTANAGHGEGGDHAKADGTADAGHGEGGDHAEGAESEGVLAGYDLAKGEEVYNKVCVACHQKDGKGMNGQLAANLADDETRINKSDEELYNSIVNGVQGTAMIAWSNQLSEHEMKSVLAYVRKTYQGKDL